MKLFSITLAAAIALPCLTGCVDSGLVYNDYYGGKPTVEIQWPDMTVSVVGTTYASPVVYVRPKVEINGTDILLTPQARFGQPSEVKSFDLGKLGMTQDQLPMAKAYWLNPNGTRQPVEIIIKK